jgi:sugar/nucleoside kinase (ribokinase family)
MRLPQVTVLGECVADAFTVPAPESVSAPDELALRVLPGGGPANTAVALARLGTPARLLARLSDDVFGRLFRRRLEASGVDLSPARTRRGAEHSGRRRARRGRSGGVLVPRPGHRRLAVDRG